MGNCVQVFGNCLQYLLNFSINQKLFLKTSVSVLKRGHIFIIADTALYKFSILPIALWDECTHSADGKSEFLFFS